MRLYAIFIDSGTPYPNVFGSVAKIGSHYFCDFRGEISLSFGLRFDLYDQGVLDGLLMLDFLEPIGYKQGAYQDADHKEVSKPTIVHESPLVDRRDDLEEDCEEPACRSPGDGF